MVHESHVFWPVRTLLPPHFCHLSWISNTSVKYHPLHFLSVCSSTEIPLCLGSWPRLSNMPSSCCLWSLSSALCFCISFSMWLHIHFLVSLTLLWAPWGLYLCFSSCLLFSRSMGGLVPWTGITDRQYLCSWGQCRWSPCRHECGQTHDNAAAMSLGDQQTAQWFEMSQERDHTRLLGRNYLSANIKRHGLWLLLFNMVRRKRRDEVQWVEGRNKKWQKSRKAGSEHNSDEER